MIFVKSCNMEGVRNLIYSKKSVGIKLKKRELIVLLTWII
jgi:hypothetical protein